MKVLFYIGFHEIKTLQRAHYPFAPCLHNGFTLCKIFHMQNVLNNGKQHVIDIAMMAKQ
jgi:hypothetical protein